LSSNGEAVVVVRLGRHGEEASLVFEILEQAGLLGEVSEEGVEMIEAGAVGFRVPQEKVAAVVLALDCGGLVDVRAYEVRSGGEQRR
jgi:hypothetical protein